MNTTLSISGEKTAEIAERVSRSDAQRKAVVKAISLVNDEVLMSQGEQDALVTDVQQVPMHLSRVVVFVVSGRNTTVADENAMRSHLVELEAKAKAKGIERIHVVTRGMMGCELAAMKWASGRAHHSEIAAVWAKPMPDGTTRRDPNARKPRNTKLRLMAERAVESGCAVFVFRYGVEEDRDTVEPLLVRAGAKPLKSSPHWREPVAEEVADVAPEPEPEASAEPLVVEGQPPAV
jgi:hypothetical protein